ncbi:polysaccharide deacetylase family protein [Streptomyces sp. NPDC048606]|uniref:polysaccharide deacetylase family protein n=1 Tax=Streptomyces sp. NPDC048606 TaxID=3154726 RepID=UPI00341CDFFE
MGSSNNSSVGSVRRRRLGSTAAATTAALLGLLAATGAPASAAPGGSADQAPDRAADRTAARSERAGAPATAPRAAREAGAAPAAATVPLDITRLAQGTGKDIAITIDDGPDPRWTPQVLGVLRENHVKATFCMVGTRAQAHPELVRAVSADGHKLCDHSVDHDVTMDHKPVAYQRQQILDGKAMIQKAVPGVSVDYYRAPGGAFTPESRAVAAAAGMRPLGWSVDPKDWSRPGLKAIVSAVEADLPRQPTVLFHDGGGDRSETVAALKEYLPWLKERGYTFTFPERNGR